jgi:CRP-like cAMP-binding protein
MREPVAARICRPGAITLDARCGGCVVRASVESGPLPSTGLEQVLQRSQRFALPARRTLYWQGNPAEALYALRCGAVKLLRKEPGGELRLVRLVKAGIAIGLETVFREPYRHTAVAIEPLEYCRIPTGVLRHMESAGRAFYEALTRQWQAHLDEADSIAGSFGAGRAEQRLARLLLKLGAMQQGQHCVSLLRSDLGSLLGVSKETASRLMADFHRRGVIRGARRQRECECDVARLRAIADGR